MLREAEASLQHMEEVVAKYQVQVKKAKKWSSFERFETITPSKKKMLL